MDVIVYLKGGAVIPYYNAVAYEGNNSLFIYNARTKYLITMIKITAVKRYTTIKTVDRIF